MAAVHSSRKARPTKNLKGGTKTTKAHRFEPFTQRIARLKIDPIRRTRRADIVDDEAATASYFRNSLEQWMDLNLSENFSQFVSQVNRISESLPQILHYEDKIMALLVDHIQKGDQLSLEPLLSLMAHFAHDLGTRFERHFSTAVTVVAGVAAKNPDVEVIEWSFSCLAWLFKFLSRLLVSDLRPTFDIMAPYLGKQRQKPFVARFAAEAFSFLIRKAGAMSERNSAPLETVVEHILMDIQKTAETGNTELYRQGIMATFVEAIKGINNGIHSAGPSILRCIFLNASKECETEGYSEAEQIACGVLVNIIHHTRKETFQPISAAVIQQATVVDPTIEERPTRFALKLLFLVTATRRGGRIDDWKEVVQAFIRLLPSTQNKGLGTNQEHMHQMTSTMAVLLQSAAMESILPHMQVITNYIMSPEFRPWFLPLCNMVSDLEPDRFQSILLPYFRRFMTSHWEHHQASLLVLVQNLAEHNCLNTGNGDLGSISFPESWQKHLCDQYLNSRGNVDDLSHLFGMQRIENEMAKNLSTGQRMAEISLEKLKRALSSPSHATDIDILFSIGFGLITYTNFAQRTETLDVELWPLLCSAAQRYCGLDSFLGGLLIYLKSAPSQISFESSHIDILILSLTENLAKPSHEIRLHSLETLQVLYKLRHGREADAIATALLIETTPLTLQTARVLSMHIRRLAAGYHELSSDQWLLRIVPYYCFGMLTVRMSQVWDDACAALNVISENKEAEDLIAELAFRWLEKVHSPESAIDAATADDPTPGIVSPFECTNVRRTEDIILKSFNKMETAQSELANSLSTALKLARSEPDNARSQALKVMNTLPHVVEKRSRHVTPLFLSWALHDSDDDSSSPESGSKDSATLVGEIIPSKWTLQDRKGILQVFTKFVNPKVLYASKDVYTALLGLLKNGDAEIQKSALKAILTWKSSSIRTFEDNLFNLLDDSRFREEITVFLSPGPESILTQEDARGDVMEVLLRLLYGKMVSRGGSRNGQPQVAKRRSVLRALSGFSESDLQTFVQIALGQLYNLQLIDQGILNPLIATREIIDERKQFALLRMVEDMLETLGSQLIPFAEQLTQAVLCCAIWTVRNTQNLPDAALEPDTGSTQTSLQRNVRSTSLKCLNLIFSTCKLEAWSEYLPTIFDTLITPRLDKLPTETAQGVSAILRIFATWSSRAETVPILSSYNSGLFDKITAVLAVDSAKDDVKVFVLEEIVQNVLKCAQDDSNVSVEMVVDGRQDAIRANVLAANVENLLIRLSSILRGSPGRDLLGSAVRTLSETVPFVNSSSETKTLLETSIFLLSQPVHRVSPRTKGDLLRVIHRFVPLYSFAGDEVLFESILSSTSSMFGYFRDRENRQTLSLVMDALAQKDASLAEVAQLCISLNSFSTQRLGEPDFQTRLQAFNEINEEKYKIFSYRQWQPLLYNMLFFIRDEDELAIRTNASFGLRRFIERSVDDKDDPSQKSRQLVMTVLFPALRKGLTDHSELVRAENVTVMAHLIKTLPDQSELSDMHVLLAGGDEEASFFNNILHIQQHRRLRALRRLASEAGQGKFKSSNICHIFIPLVEHYIFDKSEDESAHNLAAETVTTISSLCAWLDWNQFRATFRRYNGYMQSKPELEKTIIRLLSNVTNALSGAFREKQERMSMEEELKGEVLEKDTRPLGTLAASLPGHDKLSKDLATNFIPSLVNYIHNKEETEISLRVPIAITTVKLLKLLPEEQMTSFLPQVLSDVTNILRSRAQDSRDTSRKTLAEIAGIIGPSYFQYILKELRRSLARGYQLHVLSYTMHSILVITSDVFSPGELDYCVSDMVAIIIDDTFGATGQEKEAEEYISKMKEVKSSKSYDSMELLAKSISIQRLAELIRPLQALLQEKLNLGMVRKADELLRRVAVGLLRNQSAQSHDVLVFCYEVIKDVYRKPEERPKNEIDPRQKRFLVNLTAPNKAANRGSTSSYIYKLTKFALDVLRSILHKHEALLTPPNLSGFLPMIGDALVQSQEEVKVSAIRLLSTIIRVPLSELDRNAPLYVAEAVRMIKEAPSMTDEAAQAALKLFSAILRERRSVQLRESDLASTLRKLKPELDEPDRQGVAFNFLKAVMGRKIEIPEVYEVLDTVAVMMVTNHGRSARDLARGVYFQFLMDYRQGKDRWAKQLAFLVKNLDYKHQEGRQSVMEAMHLLVTKLGDQVVQDVLATFFLPLTLAMVNDESAECRELAGALLGEIFQRADSGNTQTILEMLRAWLGRVENTTLIVVALQAYRIWFEKGITNSEKEVLLARGNLLRIIRANAQNQADADWETLYFALQLFAKLAQVFPGLMLSAECASLWASVYQCLWFPHAWIKLSAAKLMGILFGDLGKTNAEQGLDELPLVGSYGIQFDDQAMLLVTRASLRTLSIPGVGEEIATQSVRNLVFLGRCLAVNGLEWQGDRRDQQEPETDEEGESDDDDVAADGILDEDQDAPNPKATKPAVQYLLYRLSAILRHEPLTTKAPSLIPKTASLKLLAALTSHLDLATLSSPSIIQTLLTPLNHLTDPTIPAPFSTDEGFNTAHKAITATAQELMSMLQKKLGTTEYVKQLSVVREGVRERREGRRVKRRIEAVAEPEKVGREKKRKGERKRERRKEKSGAERGRRRGW